MEDYDEETEAFGVRHDNRIYNGSTKLITGLLVLMNTLTAAAVVGGVIMYGRVISLDEKVNLIIEGRIQIPLNSVQEHGR